MGQTLKSLRLDHCMSHDDVVRRVAAILDQPAKSPNASVSWEFRGVNNASIVRALASIYGVTTEEIEHAARNSKITRGPSQKRGPKGPRKKSPTIA